MSARPLPDGTLFRRGVIGLSFVVSGPALAIVLAGLVLGGVVSAGAQQPERQVGLVDIDGTITPVMATYAGRGIDRSAERGDSAVILRMDTPGGLSSAMDDIVSDILASPIPGVVYVAP